MASRSTAGAILPGWLCSSDGRQCSSTGQPRRAAMSRTWPPSAPHAITARAGEGLVTGTGCGSGAVSGRERQLLDEGVVEVRAVGELHILHLLDQRQGTGPLPHGDR